MNATVLALALLASAAPEPEARDVRPNVRAGLKWLAKQQKEDGSWAGMNNASATAITATAGLALLMEGSTPKAGAYAPNVVKAVAWIEKNAAESGLLLSRTDLETTQSVAAHTQALLFLACACDLDDDEARRARVAKLVDKALAFTMKCQTTNGGWGYVAPAGNEIDDAQSTAVVLQVLSAARKLGFVVPRTCTDSAVAYLVRTTTTDGGIVHRVARGGRPNLGDGQPHISAAAASALLTHDGFRPALLPEWVKFATSHNATSLRFLRDGTGGAHALYQQYHLARAVFALGETGFRRLTPGTRDDAVRWSAFREPVFKTIAETQKPDGSWSDLYVGPAYTTALALVVLQLENDYLPAFSR